MQMGGRDREPSQMGRKEMVRQREGSKGGVGSADDGEFCVGGGDPTGGS